MSCFATTAANIKLQQQQLAPVIVIVNIGSVVTTVIVLLRAKF